MLNRLQDILPGEKGIFSKEGTVSMEFDGGGALYVGSNSQGGFSFELKGEGVYFTESEVDLSVLFEKR